jgi:alkylation response protein AidB-like acyl-CoA dehydrogenase
MDFEWTPEQRTYRDAFAGFARSVLSGDVVEADAAAAFSREAWQRCADFGVQGLPVPTEYGGLSMDPPTIVLALEGFGYGCTDNGLMFSLNAQMWACEIPLVKFGTDRQKRHYLPGLCDGSYVGAHAMTEPGSGSDAFSLTTTARRHGSEFVLNGSKTFVTNAPAADVFVVFATTDRSRALGGLSAFLVDRHTRGLSVGRPLHKMGLRTSPMSELFLDDCVVPSDAVLGEPGGGMAIFNTAMKWERSCILACAVGTMQRQLERCVVYARERKQFGLPIGKFQSVSHRIVDMKVRLEAARLVLYRAACLLERGELTHLDAALAKLYVSESFVQSSMDALTVHGGYGYTTEYELERELRDAFGGRIYSGTSDVLRNVMAAEMGL